jgi:hypothetical protein
MDGIFKGTNWPETALITSLLVIWCAGGALITWAMWSDEPQDEEEEDKS